VAKAKKKKLVVVESPNKIKKIASFLGPDFVVKSSVGHIMDLPQKGLNIDIKDDFKPTYQVIPKKRDVVKDLKAVAKDIDEVYLAADLDREGEYISASVQHVLKKRGRKFYRVTFAEITKKAVLEAFKNPGVVNTDLVEAQKTRRILDRLVGFKITPFLWQRGKSKSEPSRSAGRVQSVGLRLIVERQKEIDAFKPVKYWTVDALVANKAKKEFTVNLVMKNKLAIDSEDKADKVVATLKKYDFNVDKVTKKSTKSSSSAPFTTSTLQQAASTILHWGSKKIMSVAQKLYEQGLITYMRTDSVAISKEAIKEMRVLIPKVTSKKHLPAKANAYKVKKGKAQEAHEAIRPSNLVDDLITILGTILDTDQKNLFELIWRKAIASQMAPAIFDKVEILVKCGKYKLKALGQTQTFDGFLNVWKYATTKEVTLPIVKEGEKLIKKEIAHKEHETKPPARFNEASLVKEMEANGVGRPSTYASIIEVLKLRKYVDMDGKAFIPTPVGVEVSDFLMVHFDAIIEVDFTAKMEDALDEIAAGDKTRLEVLQEVWKELKGAIDKANINLRTNEVSTEVCPNCKASMYVRLNRKTQQEFLVCSDKKCNSTYDKDDEGKPVKRKEELLGKPCPECGCDLLKRSGKFGTFYGCKGYQNGCKITANENGEFRIPQKVKKTGKKCPKCKKDMLERKNKSTGESFFGCSGFPKCRHVISKTE